MLQEGFLSLWLLFVVVCRLLAVAASLVKHGLQGAETSVVKSYMFSSCGIEASLP